MKTKFGTGISRMGGKGHVVLGVTLGYDRGMFATIGLVKWLLVVGWCNWEQEGFAEYERQSHRLAMRRDYWDETGGAFRVATNRQHDPESDLPTHFLYDTMLEEANIQDGDEYEILITATDRQPHGGRRWIRTPDGGTFLGPIGNFRAETDNECLARIEANHNESTEGEQQDGNEEQPG